MAGPDFPRIDRRRLLATGAAVATTAIAPGAGSVEAALANAAQPASLPAEAPPLNVCAATARIAAMKRFWLSFGAILPPRKPSVAKTPYSWERCRRTMER